MYRVIVGVRIEADGSALFFGRDEVNDSIRHGMKVVSLEPGEGFAVESSNPRGDQSAVWRFTVVLDDYGIDPA